jgi:hypothetical protein
LMFAHFLLVLATQLRPLHTDVVAARKRRRARAHVMRSRALPQSTHDTSCHACLITGRAAQPETPAKDHYRFCDFSVANPASDSQAQTHSHSLPHESSRGVRR